MQWVSLVEQCILHKPCLMCCGQHHCRPMPLGDDVDVSLARHQGPDLQRILRQTYDSAALTPDLRRACELNHKWTYEKFTQNLRKT